MPTSEEVACVFGFGECPVRVLMAREKEEAQVVMKGAPVQLPKGFPPELTEFLRAMLAGMGQMMQAFSGLRDLGSFCAACPIAKKRAGE